jgi:putative peptidoglycan lipid II flippase
MNSAFKSTVLVTVYTLFGQLINFAAQIIVAYLFGAGVSMDAFNAALVLPQYVTVALLGSLGFVFLPVFVGYVSSGMYEDAWRVVSSTINFSILFTGAIVLVGIIAPETTVRLVAPGLPEQTRQIAARLSVILWPSVLANCLIIILTAVHHSERKFGWPALVAVIGAGAGLVVTILLAGTLGVVGFAIGTIAGLLVQVFLLAPIAVHKGRYRFWLEWNHAGTQQVFRLLVPLVLASIFGKATGVVERFLASSLPEGSISHLAYALRLVNMISLFFSSGVSVVVFQKMAADANSDDLQALRRTLSIGIRYLWLLVAPVFAIGISLSLPLVTIIFQRGQFDVQDAVSVARLFQVYMLSLAAASLGNITARGFYVLKDTRTVAWMGGIESVFYILYTTLLTKWLGILGIALGYVILFNGSLVWQSLLIAQKTGGLRGQTVTKSVLRTSLAAVTGGVLAWGVVQWVGGVWSQLLIGGSAGLIAYILVLFGARSPEGQDMLVMLGKAVRVKA